MFAQDSDNPVDPDAPPALESGVDSNKTTSFSEPVPQLPSNIDPDSPFAKSAQFQRWWWNYSVRSNVGTGQPAAIPTTNVTAASNVMNTSAAISPSGGLAGTRWIALGPEPFLQGSTPTSGRVTSISVDATNPAHWIIGGAQGGVWETLDTGTTWIAKTDNTASLAMGAVAMAPSNPRTMYAGTGEGNYSADCYAGRGLLKSTDGGTNWNLIATSYFAGASFTRLRVHPTNPNILWASTVNGVSGYTLASNDGTPHPQLGVLKSTDGGNTWRVTLPGAGATDLALKPGDNTAANMYAALGASGGDAANGVYRSVDAGETWGTIAGPWQSDATVARISVALAPSSPATLYVAAEDAGTSNVIGVWMSSNAWDPVPTFTQLPATTFCNGQCWYDQEMQVDPTDPLIIYVGGVNFYRYNGSTTKTFTSITTGGVHVDNHAVVFAGNRLILGNDGGLWSTTDRGVTWTDHNTNLSLSQYYHGSLPPGNETFAGTTSIPAGPGLIITGAQDNGTQLYRGAPAWRNIGGGDGLDNKISPTNPTTHWAISSQSNAIQRTLNGGQSFSTATTGLRGIASTFMTRFEECKYNEDLFIAASALNLYKNTGFFQPTLASWVANPVTLNGTPLTFDSGIMTMTFAPADTTCNTYVFSSRSAANIPYTIDGGASWRDYRTNNANLPTRTPTDYAFVPTDSNTLYMTFSGFNSNTPATPGHVFKSINAMSDTPTFTDISPAGVDIPFNTVAIDPTNTNVIYVGSDLGIWRSTDAGATWIQMGDNNSGIPNVAIFEIQTSPVQVVAFTHGRGAYRLGTYDLNGDSAVNCADVKIVTNAMNTHIGQPTYNPVADLNNDNQINVRDLAMITKQLPSGT
ncbi:MAG TPA: dockerin type I domain-containing protein, partial [Polyangiaceae bacterium]|nr:dockerin type I domain-containing protein [Polyangiaceae bacterium]